MENKTTLFIPMGYGKGIVIRDLEDNYWIVGDILIAPIHTVERIEKEKANALIIAGSPFIISKK